MLFINASSSHCSVVKTKNLHLDDLVTSVSVQKKSYFHDDMCLKKHTRRFL